jgi:putative tryptophan/tyrosine transport system substrate-binding protein
MKTVLLLISFIVADIHFAEAQQLAKFSLVGVLRGDSSPNPSVEAFQQAMRDLGYLEGRNVVIEYRYADG